MGEACRPPQLAANDRVVTNIWVRKSTHAIRAVPMGALRLGNQSSYSAQAQASDFASRHGRDI
jgi:hypothetical protein